MEDVKKPQMAQDGQPQDRPPYGAASQTADTPMLVKPTVRYSLHENVKVSVVVVSVAVNVPDNPLVHPAVTVTDCTQIVPCDSCAWVPVMPMSLVHLYE